MLEISPDTTWKDGVEYTLHVSIVDFLSVSDSALVAFMANCIYEYVRTEFQ